MKHLVQIQNLFSVPGAKPKQSVLTQKKRWKLLPIFRLRCVGEEEEEEEEGMLQAETRQVPSPCSSKSRTPASQELPRAVLRRRTHESSNTSPAPPADNTREASPWQQPGTTRPIVLSSATEAARRLSGLGSAPCLLTALCVCSAGARRKDRAECGLTFGQESPGQGEAALLLLLLEPVLVPMECYR
ncbi:uncharacterized protein PHA67_004447 [Liasis olivaceus]